MVAVFEKSNMAAEFVNLFGLNQTEVHRQIKEQNQKIDDCLEEMQLINSFLGVVERDKTEEGLRISGEDRKLVDALSQRENLQHIFAEQRYDWNKGDFEEMQKRIAKLEERYNWEKNGTDNLKRQLNQHMEGPLQREITHASELMVIKESQLNEALNLFKAGVNKWNDFISGIQRNTMQG